MKKTFLFTLLLFIGYILCAQTEELILRKNAKGAYVEHKLAPKENFYSIGRLFGVHPKHIASFNGLDMRKGLSIGQMIMIPLTDTNYSQKANSGVPVYAENKKLTGYIIAGEILQATQATSLTKEKTEAVKTDSTLKITPTDLFQNKNKGKEEAVNTDSSLKIAPADLFQNKNKEKEKDTKTDISSKDMIPASEGYFKKSFEQQAKIAPVKNQETVTSGIFKVTNGGKDAKYYALIDGVEPGTIIKVINPANSKEVFAKVLGEMKGFVQNKGLDLRISESAATALEISEQDKFIVQVNY